VPAYAYEFADRKAPMYLLFPPDFPPGAFHAAEHQLDFWSTMP
jgi:para-nitrobenzyl esterase